MLPFQHFLFLLQNIKLFVAKNRASSSVLSNSMDTPIHVASRLDILVTVKDFVRVLIAKRNRIDLEKNRTSTVWPHTQV